MRIPVNPTQMALDGSLVAIATLILLLEDEGIINKQDAIQKLSCTCDKFKRAKDKRNAEVALALKFLIEMLQSTKRDAE